jgi:CHAT domain-containing protein
MADAFRRLTGDALYVDAVAAVDGAQAQGPVAARALAAAHLEYARAAELLSQDRFTAARPRLEASLGGLVTANSPYAARARLDLEVVAYYSGQGPALTPSLVSLADEAARRSYTFVVSRSLWLQGLVAFTAGQYADAQVVWERMLATGEAMRDAEECAAAHGLLANLLHQLASNDEAWRHRIAYLDILSDYRADRIRFGLLMSAAGHALKEDAASALPIQEAVIEDALQSGRTTTLPEAYAQRAGILGALGRTRDARADLEAAWRHWGAIDDPGLRARLNAALATAEATILERIEDPAALQAAARAVELAKAREDTMRLPGLYLALARAQSRAGRVQQAEVTTDAGLELLQRSAPGVPTEQAASDDLVGLSGLAMQAALRDGDIARAYRHGAVARARTPAHESDRSTGDVLLLQRRLGPRRAVLALNQLDEELVVWLVTHSSVQISRRRLTWTQSQHLVELQHAEINLALEKPRASAALFKEVVGPFRDSLAQLDHVLIDPDAPFRSASFPALFDRSTGRFLIEDTDLTVEGGRPRGLRADGRTPFVDIPPGATPTDAIASWRAADSQALIRIHARAISNDQFPQLSHLVFADRPGLPHTGMVLVRDLPRLPEVRAVFLPNVDTGQHQISRAGTVDLASALLERGATHVITFLTPGAPGPDEWVPRLNAQGSVPATVAHLQRDELRRAHRLGTWSRLVVYGSLH